MIEKITTEKKDRIRIISTTVIGNIFAVAEWEKNVQIWDIEKALVCKFETDLVCGMRYGMSISENGKYLAIAGYDHNTITIYDTDTEKVVWQRKDLKRPSKVVILNYSEVIFVTTDTRGSFMLDLMTGQTIEKLKGIKFIRENPYSNIDHFEKSSTSILKNRTDGKTIGNFNHKSFSILDACFSNDKIFCAYSSNPLEAISLITFEAIWTVEVIGHFLEVGYCKELSKIIGIRWDYEKGGSKYLCYINLESGIIEREIELGMPNEVKFLKEGSLLITSQGKLYSTVKGLQVKQFKFENN